MSYFVQKRGQGYEIPGMHVAPMPHTENHTFDYDAATSPTNLSSDDHQCDCNHYREKGRACPCSVNFAAKTGKRAVERILHKSVFFEDANVKENVELQTEREAKTGDWKSALANHVVEIDARHVEVGELLGGRGGFCLVHNAQIIVDDDDEDGDENASHGLGSVHGGSSSVRSIATSCFCDSEQMLQDVHDDAANRSQHSGKLSLHSPKRQIINNSIRALYSKPSTEKQEYKQDYCIKFLKPTILPERRKFARGIADLAIEAHFLATLNHPHILKIRGVSAGVKLFEPSVPHLTNQPGINGGFFLILDQLHNTLDRKIDRTWKTTSEKYNSFLYRSTHDLRGAKRMELKKQRLDVALQLARAMQYLHQYNICYRDLKPDNIGFDVNDSLKLFDFGLAKELKPYKRHADGTYSLTANTGSRRYMAPEVAQRKRYNLSVDVFSFAILLWEMCALEKPFKNFTELQHTNLVVEKGHRPKLDCLKSWPAGVKDVIVKCWAQDFYARPTFAEIVQLLETLMSDFPLLEKAPSKDG